MSLMDKMRKTGSAKHVSVLSDSELLNNRDLIETGVPILDAAFSGSMRKGQRGYGPGIHLIAGPSKHFKSNTSMVFVSSYLNKYHDAICVFYDSEFGTTKDYWKSSGIDPDRVLHIAVTNIEELKFDMMQKLEQLKRGERLVFFVDSIGNLASKKEVEDALKESAAADMTRAKQLKSFFRMVTPYFTLYDIPMFAIMHTYKTMELFPKDVVSGGTGGVLSANSIFIMGRSQEKDGDEIAGWNFTLNADKSRNVKEKTKFPLLVTYSGGINKYSGLMELAIECGMVVKPKNGWYAKVNPDTGEICEPNLRLKQTNTDEFWKSILESEKFLDFVEQKFKVSHNSLQQQIESIHEEDDTIFDSER